MTGHPDARTQVWAVPAGGDRWRLIVGRHDGHGAYAETFLPGAPRPASTVLRGIRAAQSLIDAAAQVAGRTSRGARP